MRVCSAAAEPCVVAPADFGREGESSVEEEVWECGVAVLPGPSARPLL